MSLKELHARKVGSINGVSLIKLDMSFKNLFGPLGPERHVTLHWTAGPCDDSVEEAVRLCRSYHSYHASKGWGGIGYHYGLCRTAPAILLLRPVTLKGAHVGGWNTGNVGVMTHAGAGGKEDRNPTQHQVDAFTVLLRYAHTKKFPAAHRTDRKLARPYCERRGHNDWPGHEWNSCPGTSRPLLNLRTK